MDLDLELLKTVGGAVVFIELVMELFYKPLVKNLELGGWKDIITNLVAFGVGLVGTLSAGYLLQGFMPTDVANLVLVALVATAISTLGYEFVSNAFQGARNNPARE